MTAILPDVKQPAKKQSLSRTVPLIMDQVYQLAAAYRRWAEAIASDWGQTQGRWQLLSAASAGDRTVAHLARHLGLTRQSVQRTADLLVSDGLAKFADNSDHRRSPHLRLTHSGTELLDKLGKTADAYHKELAEGLRGADLKTAGIVLGKFLSQLERDLTADQTGSEYSEVWNNRVRRNK